jgi:SAM-dependent methyltransferase
VGRGEYGTGGVLLFAVTVFSSAFLLFLVQPIIAKQILPWFGGSAAVWTTCLVFFQTTLLLGYAYADWIVRALAPRRQVALHTALLVASLLALPIEPGAWWKPTGSENPIVLILGLLAATLGLPYFLLSTTSPLAQAWFARRLPGRDPYRLFALSNLASVAALLGYPFLLEPWIAARVQAWSWSVAYAGFAVLCVATAMWSLRAPMPSLAPSPPASPGPDVAAEASDADDAPGAARQSLWCSLAAMGSLLLLAVSNHITQNIASVPLLWLAPLAIYLLTFILCFDAAGWYPPRLMRALAAAALAGMAFTLADAELEHRLGLQIGVFCIGLFVACMFCHGELARLKPAPRHLTRFYLMLSLGGAVGSVMVGIVAPLVLPAYFELAFGLTLCALLLLWQVRSGDFFFRLLGIGATAVTLGGAVWGIRAFYDGTIVAKRNFYGVVRVLDHHAEGENHYRTLMHGTIMHGRQFLGAGTRRTPTTYYTETSGIGRLLEKLNPRLAPLKVGVIGLGTGTIAAYGAKGDVFRFYDINPAVLDIAQRDFSFLKDSDATIELVLGDARLSLEREPSQQFDVLAIDAFSSDAIPVHLITTQALEVYARHMKPDGVIAFHVTNRFLDLAPVVGLLAKSHGLNVLRIDDDGDLNPYANRSDWILLSAGRTVLDAPELAKAATPIQPRPGLRLWTDDFNNLVQVLKDF